jgi:2-polyprenyl-6-methoxyphenol hydroxylase-like FAD-dependent oxidoreductase
VRPRPTGSPRVLVVGAGPVGLFLAVRLAVAGVDALVIDRRPVASRATRAIGIHPPGLAALDAVGAGAAVRATAVRVRRARAWGVDGPLASLDLSPAGEVLAVPQPSTEAALEERLACAGASPPLRAHELVGFEADADGVDVTVRAPDGERRWRVELLVGCDGRASTVRGALGVSGRGGAYRDRYVMADVSSGGSGASGPADDAAIHLHPDGVVESFPLAGGRRWVVHVGTDAGRGPRTAEALLALVEARVGVRAWAPPGTPVSAFGVERFLAARFAVGRVALAGDAAHVVSPIGGQGMNLGWLDALALAAAFERGSARGGASVADELAAYAARRRRRARQAIWRAGWNTRLGRPTPLALARARDAALRRALRPPFDDVLRGFFTMRGLT